MKLARVLTVGTAATALLFSALAVPPAQAEPVGAGQVRVADADATAQTRSLMAYLLQQRGNGIMFGHQHDLTEGHTFDQLDGSSSDVHAAVGDYPAVFGWDTLILEGKERPGSATNSAAQNVEALSLAIESADQVGGINTLSAHLPNFVTGGDSWDPSGDVVAQILPGGGFNADFNAFLDRIAAAVLGAQRADGSPIPVVFRPFHENNGWGFWWGAGGTSADDFKEIWRYTVEYLRDTKGVHNLLYAYSPNGQFGGDPTTYLRTYPGDDFVDVLGYDVYDGSDASSAWLAGLAADLGMIADLAQARGKVSALTEFGQERDAPESPQWFNQVLTALLNHPSARNTAWMLTWVNWPHDDHAYVPYPAQGAEPAHPLLPGFVEYHDNPASVFAAELGDVYGRDVPAAEAEPLVHLVSPTALRRITATSVTIRARVTGAVPGSVSAVVTGGPSIPLLPDTAGLWSGVWEIDPSWLDNRSATITIEAALGDRTITDTKTVLLGELSFEPGVVDDFEGYFGENSVFGATWRGVNGPSLGLTNAAAAQGEFGLRFGYDFSSTDYAGVGKSVQQNWTAFNELQLTLRGDGSTNRGVLQIVAGGVYFEYNYSLADDSVRQLNAPFADFRPASWDSANRTKRLDADHLAEVTKFNLYLNHNDGGATTGGIEVDDIRAVHGNTEPSLPEDPVKPYGFVDDFEGYPGTAALRGAWSVMQAGSVSLSDQHSAGGHGLAYDYQYRTDNWGGIKTDFGANWQIYDRLVLWLKGDGSPNSATVQLVADGVYFESHFNLADTGWKRYEFPFAQFRPASWDTGNQDKLLDFAHLGKIAGFAFFTGRGDGSAVTDSTIYLDDLHAAGPMPLGWVDDFESYPDDDAVHALWRRTNDNTTTLDPVNRAGGAAGLRYGYDFSRSNYTGSSRPVMQDWRDFTHLKLDLKGDGSANGGTVQLVADGVYFEHHLDLADTDWRHLQLAFADFRPASWDSNGQGRSLDASARSKVTEFTLFLGQREGGASAGTVWVDNIRAGNVPNTAALSDAISAASGLAAQSYTTSSWAAAGVATALAGGEAVLAAGDPSQAEIDTAAAALNLALGRLQLRGDPAVLGALVQAGDSLAGDLSGFTAESVAAFTAALADGRAALAAAPDRTQAQLDATVSAVQAAFAGLTIATPAVNQAALQALYDAVQGLANPDHGYTAASWSKLQAAIADAAGVLASASASQAQVDAATVRLTEAVAGLESTDKRPVKLKLNQAQLRLVKGKSVRLEEAVYYREGLPPAYAGSVTWASANPRIAAVDRDGRVTAKRTGTATITVTTKGPGVNGKKLSVKIAVKVVAGKSKATVTKVSATVPKRMDVGAVAYLTGRYESAKATGVKVTYSSSKPTVAAIDRAGRLVARSKGDTVVTVRAGGKAVSYPVTVS